MKVDEEKVEVLQGHSSKRSFKLFALLRITTFVAVFTLALMCLGNLFPPRTHAITINFGTTLKTPIGSGRVCVLGANVDQTCITKCTITYPANKHVKIIAQANPDSEFVSFSGDSPCFSGDGVCDTTVDGDMMVSVNFEKKQ